MLEGCGSGGASRKRLKGDFGTVETEGAGGELRAQACGQVRDSRAQLQGQDSVTVDVRTGRGRSEYVAIDIGMEGRKQVLGSSTAANILGAQESGR
jgi:hypothetical protein